MTVVNCHSFMNKASLRVAPANRVERRRERTRRDLLAAAVRVLARKGLHDTKVADIAAAADIGVGTFYLHFPTKDALFDAVVEETVARLKATIDAARAAAPDAVARMRAANAAFCRFAQENREVFKIVFGHAAADNEETISEGVASGAFAPVPPPLAAQAVVGMATQVLSWWTEQESLSIDTLQETMIGLALRGLGEHAPDAGAPRGGPSHG